MKKYLTFAEILELSYLLIVCQCMGCCTAEKCFTERNRLIIGFVEGVLADTKDLESCVKACNGLPRCKSGTYFVDDRMCVMNSVTPAKFPALFAKSDPERTVYFHGDCTDENVSIDLLIDTDRNRPKVDRNAESSSIGAQFSKEEENEIKNRECHLEPGVKFTGVPMHGSGRVDTFEDCNALCLQGPECSSGVYNSDTKQCVLYEFTRSELSVNFSDSDEFSIYFEGDCATTKTTTRHTQAGPSKMVTPKRPFSSRPLSSTTLKVTKPRAQPTTLRAPITFQASAPLPSDRQQQNNLCQDVYKKSACLRIAENGLCDRPRSVGRRHCQRTCKACRVN